MEMIKYIDTSVMTLEELKAFRYSEIDARTGELISTGFTYAAKQFSLSDKAQLNLLGLKSDAASLTYPIEWNTIDDSDKYSITDSTDALAFYTAALTAKKGHLDSGTSLKDSVRAAVDKAGVDAVVDNR